MAEDSLLKGDVLIISFSHTNRIKLFYYHEETDFKEVKNLPIVKNIGQLQPIIFQFIEDFLRSRIEAAFEKPDVIFNPDRLSGTILLFKDSALAEPLIKEIEDFFGWLVETIDKSEFHKVLVEKTSRNPETLKIEKIVETLYADYQLSICLINPSQPEAFQMEKLEKSGFYDFKKSIFSLLVSNEILKKAGNITKVTKDLLLKDAFNMAHAYIDSSDKNWMGEIIVANKPYSFLLSAEQFEKTLSEKEHQFKKDKTNLNLQIPYHDINNLFSLLNNRNLNLSQFNEELEEAFGKVMAQKLIDFLNPGEKISPQELSASQAKIHPLKGLANLRIPDLDEDTLSALDRLIEDKVKQKKHFPSRSNQATWKWVIFSGLLLLLLTAVFAIPAIISPPVNCNHSLLLEIIRGNTHQVKRMVHACPDFRNPEQQVISINNHDYSSPIILAIANGDLETVKFLHEKGEIPLDIREKNVNNPSVKGWTAPWTSVAFNQPKILDYLIEKEINLDTRQEKNGETPLIHAISVNNKYLAEKLLHGGADPDFPDSRGISPLLYAITLDLPEIAKSLLLEGASKPPFLSDSEFNARIKSENMKMVLRQNARFRYSFLDAFQGNSPFRNNIDGSFIDNEEHLIIHRSLFRIYPFDLSAASNYLFSCSFDQPSQEDSGELGVIFSSLPDDKWQISLDNKGNWKLKNNTVIVQSGSIKVTEKPIQLLIKRNKNLFEFQMNDQPLLTYRIDEIPGNYFGFQVEDNFRGGRWSIEKYKLTAF
jgi:ankyrin repeat protein